jgi:hypothetical protein
MSNDKEEKFVTIDFETWERKYKPMEWELKRLESKLEERKLELRVLRYHSGGHRAVYDIGIVDFREGGIDIKGFDKYQLIRALEDQLGGIPLMTTEELRATLEKLNSIDERINNLPAIVRWLFKIKKL